MGGGLLPLAPRPRAAAAAPPLPPRSMEEMLKSVKAPTLATPVFEFRSEFRSVQGVPTPIVSGLKPPAGVTAPAGVVRSRAPRAPGVVQHQADALASSTTNRAALPCRFQPAPPRGVGTSSRPLPQFGGTALPNRGGIGGSFLGRQPSRIAEESEEDSSKKSSFREEAAPGAPPEDHVEEKPFRKEVRAVNRCASFPSSCCVEKLPVPLHKSLYVYSSKESAFRLASVVGVKIMMFLL